MNAYVFSNQSSANQLGPIVDGNQGYPKAGFNIGGGVHVVPLFVTQRYADVLAHPTLPEWAYPADAITQPALTTASATTTLTQKGIVLPAPVALDTAWGAQFGNATANVG